jgi:hypothetical protein
LQPAAQAEFVRSLLLNKTNEVRNEME